MPASPQGAPAPILLAFSGGLDTSFLVPWLAETCGRPVVTVTVNTGGFDDAAAQSLAQRALALGASSHHLIDARREYFDRVLKWLLIGNVRRGQLYPLCVGAERAVQAQVVAEMAGRLGSGTIAHGCTAAGNDQVRFEVALRTLAPGLEILAPVRDRAFRRPEQLAYLQARGLPLPPHGATYSTNHGLWGLTIGGRETLTSTACIPESAWVLSRNAFDAPVEPRRLSIAFTRGVPSGLDGMPSDPVDVIESLEAIAGPFGIGRGIHLGDTIIGTKGRVAFEAPAATVLIEAHRELEKLVLSARQQRVKDLVAAAYGDLVHEGQNLDPVCRDIESLFASSQARVSGTVTVLLRPGSAFIEGVESSHSLMKASRSVYGEAAGEWTAEDARGYSKMLALPGVYWSRAAAGDRELP
jgi:argininosuccinate synthase